LLVLYGKRDFADGVKVENRGIILDHLTAVHSQKWKKEIKEFRVRRRCSWGRKIQKDAALCCWLCKGCRWKKDLPARCAVEAERSSQLTATKAMGTLLHSTKKS
jgi:hypothetical protein